MKISYLLSNILKGVWAIDERELSGWMPQVRNWLNGTLAIDDTKLMALSPLCISDENSESSYNRFDEAPENSIAIFNVEGPMLRKGNICVYGTEEIAAIISEATKSEKITGGIIKIDSGGGTIDSVNPLIEAINEMKAAGKPVIAFVDSALSAGYWVASAANHIIASNELAETGSIGVFVRFADDSKMLESEGRKIIEIYAPESSDKNSPIRKAIEGDFELMETEVLSPIATAFQDAIKTNRGKKLNLETAGLLSGKTFYAKAQGHDAIAAGLIDEIGNFQTAVNKVRALTQKNISKKSNQLSTFSKINMNRQMIPALAFVLGFETLESVEGKYSFAASDVAKLQEKFASLTGKHLNFAGATFSEDGSLEINEKSLFSLNASLTQAIVDYNSNAKAEELNLIKENLKGLKSENDELKAKLSKISDEPEVLNLPKKTNVKGKSIQIATVGVNAVDDLHPWNKAALEIAQGNKMYAHQLIAGGLNHGALAHLQDELVKFGTSTLDLTQMKNVLGDSFIEQNQEVKSMLVANEEISSIFPWRSTGIKDELPGLTLYASEFLQPRNAAWAEKGGFEIQADLIKVKNWQVSHRYTAAQMWSFIESWLATKTTGTDPFQESLVQWLTNYMTMQIAMVERPVNAIRGVYLTPQSGVAGASINSMDGLFINLIRLMRDNRILPYRVGKGNYELLDGSGNPNKNHVYHKIHDLIKKMPQNLRDAFRWNVYISKQDKREYDKFLKEVVAVNSNYADIERVESYDNFNIVAVPHWVDGLIVVTMPGNILQGYRERNDDNRIYFDKEKRDTIVFMDGGYVIAPVLSGYKYSTYNDLVASAGAQQRIFTNAEFGPFTPLPIAADDATPSIGTHNVLVTSANSGATTITSIDDAQVGDVFYIIGGSDTNSSRILANDTDFIGLTANITFSTGVVAKFQCTAAGKFTLVSLYEDTTEGAVMFAADDETPSVAGAYLFVTNPANSAATDITDFDDAVVGVPFTVLGGGGTNASTITKADKFAYISASWTGDSGESITLMKRADGNFVEVLA